MTVEKIKEGGAIVLRVQGRLDTTTAPDFDKYVEESVPETNELVFDFKELEYVSSAGLRIILKAHKEMAKKGSLTLKNVCDAVMDVLDISGFSDILTIE